MFAKIECWLGTGLPSTPSKSGFQMNYSSLLVILWALSSSFIRAKVMVSKPILAKSSGVAAECPKASKCQACLGVIPNVFYKKACPAMILTISSS